MPASAEDHTQAYHRWLAEPRLLDRLTVAFVVGPMKSGTTWMCRSVNAHPEAVCRDESHIAEWLWPRLDGALREYDERLHNNGYNPDTGLTGEDRAFLMRLTMDRQLVRYLTSEGRAEDASLRVVADKTPAHAFHLRELADAYPLARFVCCERDPRDTAVSAWMHLHEMHGHRPADDFPSYTRHYVERIWAPATAAGRALLAELGPQRVILAPYERHKRDTHGQLRDLFLFLGLDASDAIVERVAESQSFQRVTNRPPGVEAKDRNRKGVVGDWINHMSPEFGDELLAIADGALGKWKEPPLEASRGSALTSSAFAERR